MDIFSVLENLTAASGAAGHPKISELCAKLFAPYCDSVETHRGSVICQIDAGAERTLLIDAHLDEIGLIVRHIDENGFVAVAKCGGVDVRTLPGGLFTIWGREPIPAVVCVKPPHLAKKEDKLPDIDDIYLDTGMDKAAAMAAISEGDSITAVSPLCRLGGNLVSGKALDDRAGVMALLLAAEKLHSAGELPVNVIFLLSAEEELGCRGAGIAAFKLMPNESIAVDVSYGLSPGVSAHKAGELGKGPIIGISPTLDDSITAHLTALCQKHDIPFQTEVMGGKTSTNADVISVTQSGIPTGLISIPLRNMHTPAETASLDDIEAVANLICAYAQSGGSSDD